MGTLIYGAGLLINSSEKIAIKQNISLYIVSATLIAFGTSLPEMAASFFASLENHTSLAVANVIGSTIFNTSFVIGIVFLLSGSIVVKKDIFREDSFWIVIPVIFFVLLGYDGVIDAFDGIIFLTMMVAFIYHLVKSNNLEEFADSELDSNDLKDFSWIKTIFTLILGFVFVIGGAKYAIDSSVNIAHMFGIQEWIIGIFMVAFGTSLPELVVGITAAINKKADMLVGTIIGSNIANFSMVLGLSSLVNDLKFSIVDSTFDILLAILCVIVFLFITANKMYNKSAGIILLSMTAMLIYQNVKNYI
jgi:cation:H+ antiporter